MHTNLITAVLRNTAATILQAADNLRDEEWTKRETEMLDLLRRIEWSYPYHGYSASCPICKHHPEAGHAGDCAMRRVLSHI